MMIVKNITIMKLMFVSDSTGRIIRDWDRQVKMGLKFVSSFKIYFTFSSGDSLQVSHADAICVYNIVGLTSYGPIRCFLIRLIKI
jgi:hypothetical protein